MPRIPTLKTRLSTDTRSRLQVQQTTRNPDAEKRTRGRSWMEKRDRWFRNHPLCAECERQGRVTAATQLDHVVPLIDGGADDDSNYQSLCVPCHKEKTAREAKER